MKRLTIRFLLGIVVIFTLFTLITGFIYLTTKPSLDRQWSLGQEQLAGITLGESGAVHITNMRDFDWSLPNGMGAVYKEVDFNISDIKELQVVVSHFAPSDAIAHVFLIFTLKSGEQVAVSVEGRREEGEEFTLLGGLTARYEFMYVVGTAHDLISLRQQRSERMQRYTIEASEAQVQKLFVALSESINTAHTTPRLYHLFFKNCVNSLTREVHRLNSDYNFSFLVSSFIPGTVGKMLKDMGVVREAEVL